MIDFSNYKSQEKQLNNCNFEKEGEYIIQKKPKYKYELRIVHKNPNRIDIKRSKTPDVFFCLLGDRKRKNDIKQNNIRKKNRKNKNIEKTPEHVSNKRFIPENTEKFIEINKNNKFSNNCICKNELEKIINQYYAQKSEEEGKNKYNNNIHKNIYEDKNEKNNIYNNSYGIDDRNDLNNNNYSYYNKCHNQRKIIKINNNNFSHKNSSSHKKRKKMYKNKKIKMLSKNIEENNINNNSANFSFLSVDASNRNQILNPIISTKELNNIYKIHKNNKKNINKNCNNIISSPNSNSRKNKSNLFINKSSETKQKLKIVPLGIKIKPLIIKKVIEKPKIVKIINKDGSKSNIIKQNSVITSIESKSIMNNGKENIVKESITKVYTTLSKTLDKIDYINNHIIIDNNDNNDNINDNININMDKNKINEKYREIKTYTDGENNSVFIRRDFKNKNENVIKLEIINDSNKADNNIGKNYLIKRNIKNENLEINDNSSVQRNSDYNSPIFTDSLIIKNEQINSMKNINKNNEINKPRKCFLKINDEENKNIVNSLNDGNNENKKLKEKKNNEVEENAIIVNKNSFEDNEENKNK